jgi:hypothetical protein
MRRRAEIEALDAGSAPLVWVVVLVAAVRSVDLGKMSRGAGCGDHSG